MRPELLHFGYHPYESNSLKVRLSLGHVLNFSNVNDLNFISNLQSLHTFLIEYRDIQLKLFNPLKLIR